MSFGDDSDEEVQGGAGEDRRLWVRARALYDYNATEANQISFKYGDIVTVTDRKNWGAWWYCRSGDKAGIAPSNYLDILPEYLSTAERLSKQAEADKNVPVQKVNVKETRNLLASSLLTSLGGYKQSAVVPNVEQPKALSHESLLSRPRPPRHGAKVGQRALPVSMPARTSTASAMAYQTMPTGAGASGGVSSAELDKLRSEAAESEKQRRELEKERNQLRKDLKALEAKHQLETENIRTQLEDERSLAKQAEEDLKEIQDQLKTEHAKWQQERSALEDKLQSSTNQKESAASAELAQLKREQTEWRRDRPQLEGQIETLKTELDKLKRQSVQDVEAASEAKVLRQQVTELQAALSAKNGAAAAETSAELTSLRVDLEKERRRAEKLESDNVGLAKQAEESRALMEKWKREESARAASASELDGLQQQLAAETNRRRELEGKKLALETNLLEVNRKLKLESKSKARMDASVKKLEAELKEFKRKLSELLKLIEKRKKSQASRRSGAPGAPGSSAKDLNAGAESPSLP